MSCVKNIFNHLEKFKSLTHFSNAMATEFNELVGNKKIIPSDIFKDDSNLSVYIHLKNNVNQTEYLRELLRSDTVNIAYPYGNHSIETTIYKPYLLLLAYRDKDKIKRIELR
jgi:hypothetical protein